MPKMNSGESGWTRKLSEMETFLCHAHEKKFMIIRYTIHLSSKNPLQETDVRSALIHLHRKVPTLRLCVRRRDDQDLWFRVREDENVDFEIGESCDFAREHKEILYHRFSTSDGPLWCARLFPLPADTPCPMPEIEDEYPQHSILLFAFHHSITDGSSNLRICDLFMKLLNDIISGNDINDVEQLGNHISPEEEENLMTEVLEELKDDETQWKALQDLFEEVAAIDIKLHKVYPSDCKNISRTEVIYHDLSVDETYRLMQKCRLEGVTMNSAISTAVNAATLEILRKAGIKEEIDKIPIQNLVNMRRYWKDQPTTSLGAAICNTTMLCKVGPDIVKNFWDYARIFNSQIKDSLKHKGPFREMVVKNSIGSDMKNFLTDDMNEILNYYYTTSNLGNLAFKGEGEHVQVTRLSRCTSLQKLISVHEMHTFRGRLLYSVDYCAEYLSEEGAQLWCDTIFRILEKVM